MSSESGDDRRRYDAFICYAWAGGTKQWADELHGALLALGLTVFQDDKGTSAEDPDEMLPAVLASLRGSRVLVSLITPQFYDSPHCHKELVIALNLAYRLDNGSTRRVIPVTWRVPPDQVWPRQLRRRQLLTREGHDVAELAAAIARIVDDIRVLDSRRLGDAPSYMEPEWFPKAVPGTRTFHGRDRELWDLHDALQAKHKPSNRGHPVVSVRGVGGQGKTALCEQYARWKAEDHPGGVFVIRLSGSDRHAPMGNAALKASFYQQLRLIGKSLDLPEDGRNLVDLRAALRRSLRGRPPYLWIVDDVPSMVDAELLPELFAPTEDGKTLITTRGRLVGLVSSEFDLNPLDPRAGLALLTSLRPAANDNRAERQAGRMIVQELGGHPLGLKVAAGLTTSSRFTGYCDLLDNLRAATTDALELAAHLRDELPLNYARPLSVVLLRALHDLGDAGRDVLTVASVLSSAPIPRDLLVDILPNGASVRSAVEEGLTHLLVHGLVDESVADPELLYTVHAMVSRATRVLVPQGARRRAYQAALGVLSAAVSAARGSSVDRRAIIRYLPHVQAVADVAIGAAEWTIGINQWYLLNESGRLRSELGDSHGSVDDFRRLYTSCLTSPECDPLTRLRVMVGLGAALSEDGQYSDALRVQAETVQGMEAELGPAHSDTLWAMNNLANTYGHIGQPGAARALLETVYRTWRDTRGKAVPETLTALNNLVIAVGREERPLALSVALRYAHGAYDLWHRTAGPAAIGTLDSLNSLGVIHFRLGDARAAVEAFGRVWTHRRAVLGEDHPDTISAGENTVTAQNWIHRDHPAVSDAASRHELYPFYANRLRVQGPGHLATAQTLWRLVQGRRHDPSGPGSSQPLPPTPSDLPAGTDLGDVRLEGDHAELMAGVVTAAVAWQGQCVAAYGPDDARTLVATALLAHALAAADQLDGQIEAARVMIEDAREGLSDLAVRSPSAVTPTDLQISQHLHHWILHLLDEEPRF